MDSNKCVCGVCCSLDLVWFVRLDAGGTRTLPIACCCNKDVATDTVFADVPAVNIGVVTMEDDVIGWVWSSI